MVEKRIIMNCHLTLSVIRKDLLRYLLDHSITRSSFAYKIGCDKWTITRFLNNNAGINGRNLLLIVNEIYL